MGEPARKGLPWGRGLAQSALGTVNLVVAGVAAVGAAVLQSPTVALIGAAAYAALVAWDLVSPEHWRKVVRDRGDDGPRLPEERDLSDPDTRKAVADLRKAQLELQRLLDEDADPVHRYMGLALASVSELEARAARLARRSEDLARYLARTQRKEIEEEMERLEADARRTPDADARQQFESARAARQQQLRTLQDLADAHDRVRANLSRIVATYQGLPARVVHMRALDAQAADSVSGDVNQELDRMNHEIAAFEETLKCLAVQVPA